MLHWGAAVPLCGRWDRASIHCDDRGLSQIPGKYVTLAKAGYTGRGRIRQPAFARVTLVTMSHTSLWYNETKRDRYEHQAFG